LESAGYDVSGVDGCFAQQEKNKEFGELHSAIIKKMGELPYTPIRTNP
jgi:hypothetical protein